MRFDTWDDFMAEQRRTGLLGRISDFVTAERAKGAVYPPSADVFAFTTTPLRDVKVVILGQDPYHQPGQAHGLAFSVRDAPLGGLPPSLRNIIKELRSDVGPWIAAVGACDLTPWTRQGVLLLNTALTVRHGEAGSHLDIWRPFTDEVVRTVVGSSQYRPHFVLWGRHARDSFQRALSCKLQMSSPTSGLYLTKGVYFGWGDCVGGVGSVYYDVTAIYSAHPSPLSADKGFFGSRPFSHANVALTLNNPGCAPVDWRLS